MKPGIWRTGENTAEMFWVWTMSLTDQTDEHLDRATVFVGSAEPPCSPWSSSRCLEAGSWNWAELGEGESRGALESDEPAESRITVQVGRISGDSFTFVWLKSWRGRWSRGLQLGKSDPPLLLWHEGDYMIWIITYWLDIKAELKPQTFTLSSPSYSVQTAGFF